MTEQNLELTTSQLEIFNNNQKLIHDVIKKFITNPDFCVNEYEDLVQIGSIGLIKAIKTYNPEKGKFSTYAVNVIRNEIYNGTRRMDKIDSHKCDYDDVYIESCASMVYDNSDEFYESYFQEKQTEILSRIAKKYGGIAENGVNAIMLTLEGYTSKDIAEQYGVEPATITSWISRARSKLKNEPEILKLLDR